MNNVIVRFVNNLKLRHNYRFELVVCIFSMIFGVFASAVFSRKDYVPENIIVLVLGLMPFAVLTYDTMNCSGFGHLPLFNINRGNNVYCRNRGGNTNNNNIRRQYADLATHRAVFGII